MTYASSALVFRSTSNRLLTDLRHHAGSAALRCLCDQAVSIVLRRKKASTSYIQQRLQIDYIRAAQVQADRKLWSVPVLRWARLPVGALREQGQRG